MHTFTSTFRLALEEQLKNELSEENEKLGDQFEDFDIKSILKGMLIELERVDNPLQALESATAHLTEDSKYYATVKVIEGESPDEQEIELVEEEDEIAEPSKISTQLIQIANTIDNSRQPSKDQIIIKLEKIMSSIRRHPHFKTVFRPGVMCRECNKNGGHYNWCPLGTG